jgi:hypothetical protein
LLVAAVHGEDEYENVPLLTEGFTKSFYAGKVCDHHAVGNQFPYCHIVTSFESKYKTIELGNYINQEK